MTSSTAFRRLLYDGGEAIAEYASSNALARRYVPGASADEALVWYEGSTLASRNWLAADARGSLMAVVNSAGAATSTSSYDPYGAPVSTGASPRFGYTGQLYLPEIGLSHYKARAYNPETGRFMQPDPIGYAGGLNLYAYAGNDPVNRIDPTGLTDWTVCAGDVCNSGSFGNPWVGNGPLGFHFNFSGGAGSSNESGGSGETKVCIIVTGSRIPACVTVKEDDENCDTPLAPAGVSIDQNIATAANHADDPFAFKLAWFYSMTRNGGEWDYKQLDKGYWRPLIESGAASRHPFEAFGNFNFGATAEAAGIDFEFAQKAAGWAQREAGTSNPNWGHPGFPFPNSPIGAEGFYGNDPRDYFDSLQGQAYAQNCN